MKTALKIIVLLAMVLLFSGMKVVQARDEFTKKIQKDFTVNPNDKLILDNKYGNIQCLNWEKNSVSIEVTITVLAHDQDDANKLFDRISIVFNNPDGVVEARTVMQEGRTPGNSHFSIDYKVNMPVTLNLDLSNKYGDVFINELSGKGNLKLGYGNMDINKLSNSDNLLDIKYSKVDVESMKGAVVMLKYSEMQLGYAGSIMLDSKYSDLDADKVVFLNIIFEGGKLSTENSSTLMSKSKYSDLKINRLEKNLNLDIQYGSCTIAEMPADFTDIVIKNRYANVDIGISPEASYSLEANLKYCDLDFPEEMARLSQKIIQYDDHTYIGRVGRSENSGSKVKIDSEYGNVKLQ